MSKNSPNLEKLKYLHFRHHNGLLSAISIDGVAAADSINDEEEQHLPDSSGTEKEICGCSTQDETTNVARSLVKDASKLRAKVGARCKVFVGNISFKVKTWELNEFFSYFGKVIHAQIIQDRIKKRSRGFGFVIFSNEWEAAHAKSASESERSLDGRIMTVLSPQRRSKQGHTDAAGPSLQEALEIYQGNQSGGNCTGKQNVAIADIASGNKDDLETAEEQRECQFLSNGVLSSYTVTNSSFPSSLIMDRLNEDEMLHIFSYLTVKERIQLERVCRRWRVLAIKSWQYVSHLDFHGIFVAFKGCGGLTDDMLLSVLRRGCQNLKSLDLSASSHFLTEFTVHCVGKHCKNLKYLDLSGVDMGTSALKALAKECTQLEVIKLERCYKVGEKALWWLLKQCKLLQHINVARNKRLTGQCFFMLSQECERLTLQGCSHLTDVGLGYVGDNCQNLKAVDLSECSSLTDTGILQFFQNCTRIDSFALSQPGREVTTRGLIGLHYLTMLRELDLSRNEAVSDEVLYNIGRSCIHLISLNLEACQGEITDAGLQSLASCYQLASLVVSYLDKVTDVSISQLAANGALEAFVARVCNGLSDQGVESLLKHCARLRSLDLSGCLAITDNSLEYVREYCVTSDRPLLEFTVGGTSVTDDAVTLTHNTLSRCHVATVNLSSQHLRNDIDPYLQMGPFLPPDEDEDEDDDFDDFDETEDSTWQPDEELAEDFLVCDDPSLMYELERT